jgi:outer membrane protein TolC
MQSQRLVRNLKNSYYELYETDRKLEINQQNLNLMRQLQDITRKQYELGMGNQSDVLRAQTEYSSLQNVRLMLNQSRQSAAVEINSLLNRQADTPLGVLPSMEIPQNQVWTLGQLTVLVEKNQPELNAARFGIAMSNAEHGASFWGFFPDLMVKGAYKQFPSSPDNFWELMVGITLPGIPWSLPKYIAKYEQTSATANQSEAAFRQTRNMVFAQVQQTLFRVKTNRDIEQLSRTTLLPQAEQTLQSTLAAYQTGKRDFMTLLDAYRTLWMARENYVMTVRNLLTSQADLEQAVGLSLPEIEAMLATHGGQ